MKSFWSHGEVLHLPDIKRIYENKYLVALRRSFYALIPFWLTVAFFDFLGNFVLDPNGFVFGVEGLNLMHTETVANVETGSVENTLPELLNIYRNIVGAAYLTLSVVFTALISEKLAEIWNADAKLTMLCSVVSLVLMIYSDAPTLDGLDYNSRTGFWGVIFVSFFTAKIFATLCHKKFLRPKVPKAFPEEMRPYLAAFFPVLLTMLIFSGVSFLTAIIQRDGEELLKSLAASPAFQNVFFVSAYQFVDWLLWWLGIFGHGATAPLMEYVYAPAQANNRLGETAAIFTSGFFQAVVIHVAGMMIAVLVFSQHESWRTITKFCLPTMAFNIPEVFMFGLPVVMNPLFIIPFILAPLANVVVGYFAISWGIVPIFQTDFPWMMPLFFGAMLGTHSIMGGVLQAVWLVMDIFIYAPFVITANSIEFEKESRR